MKVQLIHRDQDLDLEAPLSSAAETLEQDLGLGVLFEAMAGGDPLVRQVCRSVILSSLDASPEEVAHRQAVVQDCLLQPEAVRQLYALAGTGIRRLRDLGLLGFYRSPGSVLYGGVKVLGSLAATLRELRALVDAEGGHFQSQGFRTFCAILQEELDDAFFEEVQRHRKELEFPRGVLLSATLGPANKGRDYVLRALPTPRGNWVQRLLGSKEESYSFSLAPRDEAGHRALSELKDRGINLVANAIGQSNDHIVGFLHLLRNELAFYVGCITLYEKLRTLGLRFCFPQAHPAGVRRHAAEGLYDLALALSMGGPVVANDLDLGDRCAVVVTGANRGGKSTFLRSIGQAQVLMQAGLFVPAKSFEANVCEGIYSHFKREEDRSLTEGKLDEELSRLSQIVDQLRPNSLVLLNESFSSTNERDGSEIARQVIMSLTEKRIKVFFVTHLYEFSRVWHETRAEDTVFLRAERLPDGRRTFRVVPGDPLETSFAEDLYAKIFTGEPDSP